MVEYEFTWQLFSYYEDEEEDIETEITEYWKGETLEDLLNEASDYWDWDDKAVINFSALSDLTETSRDLVKIKKKDPITKKWIKLDVDEFKNVCQQYYKLEDQKMNNEDTKRTKYGNNN